MSDIVERLLDIYRFGIYKVPEPHKITKEAADTIENLREELDNERARGIHSCGPNCQRTECMQRREIERLEAEVERHKRRIDLLEASELRFCEYEDCDQEPMYCEGHMRELCKDGLSKYRGEIEQLQARNEQLETAMRDDMAGAVANCGKYGGERDCAPWVDRGLRCSDCPVEVWLSSTHEALAALEE